MIAFIELNTNIINIINKYYNKNNAMLFILYNDGICISQNINNSSNINFYIPKSELNNYIINETISFILKEDIKNLNQIKIFKEKTKFLVNNKYCDILRPSCNFCKNICDLSDDVFVSCTKELLLDIDLGWLNDILIDEMDNVKFIYNKDLNGFYIKKYDHINFYINFLIE